MDFVTFTAVNSTQGGDTVISGVNPYANILFTGIRLDQIGVNANPSGYIGVFTSNNRILGGETNTYVETTSKSNKGVAVYTLTQSGDRSFTGSDVRGHKGSLYVETISLNNDPAFNPLSGQTYNLESVVIVGSNGTNGPITPCYGTHHGISSTLLVFNQGSSSNEYTPWFGVLIAGTYDNHLTAGGHFWFTDWALQGPISVQPGILNGISLVTNNFFNGSPSIGLAAACALQSFPGAGGGTNYMTQGENSSTLATAFPFDIGLFVGGYTTGGTNDGYTNAIQVGGNVGVWGSYAPAGDTGGAGQHARGVVVKKKSTAVSCCRLGSFISEGQGEAGGLIFGNDTSDGARASIYRPSGSGLTLNSQMLAFFNGTVAAKPVITGSIGGNVALSGLLVGLASLNLITNNTTA